MTFIIAEVGSNWRNLDDCLLSIRSAKACGADAVKFQLYDKVGLYGAWHSPPHFSEIDLLPGQLNPEWLPRLKSESDRASIEFMCSAFSPELIDSVDPFVKRHKLASAEMTHIRMLDKLRKIGKPVIMSTGASGADEIKCALHILHGDSDADIITGAANWGPKRPDVTLMYCVSAYPARIIDLYHIHNLRNQFGVPVGYSDHSTDVETIPPVAVSHGATVIEKHVTFIEAATPDSPHSLNEREFKRMVHVIRERKYPPMNTPAPMFYKYTGASAEENDMVSRHKRRLIATRDIAAGEEFIEGVNFGIYRSLKDDSKAIHPFAIYSVIGKKARNAVKAGDGIGPNDV